MMKQAKIINNQTEIIYVNAILSHLKGNKAPHFNITGEIWAYSKTIGRKKGRDCLFGSCIHKDILKHFPQLADLVALHLADMDGTPMYALENGWYHLQNDNIKAVANLMRITEDKATALKTQYTTKEDFATYVASQKERWSNEAKQAIEKYNLEIIKG